MSPINTQYSWLSNGNCKQIELLLVVYTKFNIVCMHLCDLFSVCVRSNGCSPVRRTLMHHQYSTRNSRLPSSVRPFVIRTVGFYVRFAAVGNHDTPSTASIGCDCCSVCMCVCVFVRAQTHWTIGLKFILPLSILYCGSCKTSFKYYVDEAVSKHTHIIRIIWYTIAIVLKWDVHNDNDSAKQSRAKRMPHGKVVASLCARIQKAP